MDEAPILQVLRERLEDYRSHSWKEKGDKYYHGLRTAVLAKKLRRALFPEDWEADQVLTVAGWFHDLRNGQPDHERLGAKETGILLSGLCSPEQLEEVQQMIAYHDTRDHNPAYSHRLLLLQDADLLDHFGTYDVWFAFCYAAEKEMSLEEMVQWLLQERGGKRQAYFDLLNFPLSQSIYLERFDYVQQFALRMQRELHAETVGFPELEMEEGQLDIRLFLSGVGDNDFSREIYWTNEKPVVG